MLKLLPTITLKFYMNSLFMINVLRSHGRTCKIFNVWPSKNFVQDLARTNTWAKK